MSIKKVLLTGGRAPSTLELARFFSKDGIEVHIADSFPYALSKKSKYIHAFHVVSKPKQETKKFISDIQSIITHEQIDLLIPTCEEIFYISKYKESFSPLCHIFVEAFDTMQMLHNKYDFIKKAESLGLPVPWTVKIKSKQEWDETLSQFDINKKYVGKPIYTRFSNELIFLPNNELESVNVHVNKQWVIQERLDGEQFCTYSIIKNGKILAHTCYESLYRAGEGASIAFAHTDEALIYQWVEKFVKEINFTGQIAFDFFKTPKGDVFPIECNPRLTSGIHLFRDMSLIDIFKKETLDVVKPSEGKGVMLTLVFILYFFQNVKSNGGKKYLKTLFNYKDAVFSFDDIIPSFYQYYSYFQFWKLSKKKQIDLLEATVYDISWDGEE